MHTRWHTRYPYLRVSTNARHRRRHTHSNLQNSRQNGCYVTVTVSSREIIVFGCGSLQVVHAALSQYLFVFAGFECAAAAAAAACRNNNNRKWKKPKLLFSFFFQKKPLVKSVSALCIYIGIRMSMESRMHVSHARI